MARYRVLVQDRRLGAVGSIVDLDPEKVAWFNCDRACVVLELVVEALEARAIDAPPQDRMIRKARTRKQRGES